MTCKKSLFFILSSNMWCHFKVFFLSEIQYLTILVTVQHFISSEPIKCETFVVITDEKMV